MLFIPLLLISCTASHQLTRLLITPTLPIHHFQLDLNDYDLHNYDHLYAHLNASHHQLYFCPVPCPQIVHSHPPENVLSDSESLFFARKYQQIQFLKNDTLNSSQSFLSSYSSQRMINFNETLHFMVKTKDDLETIDFALYGTLMDEFCQDQDCIAGKCNPVLKTCNCLHGWYGKHCDIPYEVVEFNETFKVELSGYEAKLYSFLLDYNSNVENGMILKSLPQNVEGIEVQAKCHYSKEQFGEIELQKLSFDYQDIQHCKEITYEFNQHSETVQSGQIHFAFKERTGHSFNGEFRISQVEQPTEKPNPEEEEIDKTDHLMIFLVLTSVIVGLFIILKIVVYCMRKRNAVADAPAQQSVVSQKYYTYLLDRYMPAQSWASLKQNLHGLDQIKECCICLMQFDSSTHRVRLTKCYHLFHDNCITYWVKQLNKSCPQCRHDLFAASQLENNYIHNIKKKPEQLGDLDEVSIEPQGFMKIISHNEVVSRAQLV